MTARLTRIKTLQSFDFSFQPSLDRNRVLAIALGVEAVKAGRSVFFGTLAEMIIWLI